MCSLKRQKHQKLMPISMLERTLEVNKKKTYTTTMVATIIEFLYEPYE